jgi:hypothetical protein
LIATRLLRGRPIHEHLLPLHILLYVRLTQLCCVEAWPVVPVAFRPLVKLRPLPKTPCSRAFDFTSGGFVSESCLAGRSAIKFWMWTRAMGWSLGSLTIVMLWLVGLQSRPMILFPRISQKNRNPANTILKMAWPYYCMHSKQNNFCGITQESKAAHAIHTT